MRDWLSGRKLQVYRISGINLASNPEKRCSPLSFLTAMASALRWPISTTRPRNLVSLVDY